MDRLNQLTHSELLKLKLSQLKLSLRKSDLWQSIERVKLELTQKNIRLSPHFWISDEWFTPDGVTGVAVPFFLLHPRLIELERQQIGFLEGESKVELLNILRHELGHVVDNAFRLRHKRSRSQVFGKASISYPTGYSYRPYSRSFVRNLADGYAQGHPVEDFAETFATWLNPRSNWRRTYGDWPAIKKLQYVDTLMKEIAGVKPKLISKERYNPLSEQEITLERYYKKRRCREHLGEDHFWNDGFNKYFSSKSGPNASSFLRHHRKEFCREVAGRVGHPQYLVNQMLNQMIEKSTTLGLSKKSVTSKDDLSYYLTKKIKKFVDEGRHIIAL